MLALVALLFAAASPPAAYVGTGTARVPLAITSWCWDARCGAPLGRTERQVVVSRGAPVRVELKFDAVAATVSVSGARTTSTARGREVVWTAKRAGGLTVNVRYLRGWVIYSARLTVR